MASNFSKLFDTAKHFIHGILAKFNPEQVKDHADKIIDRAFELAQALKDRKLPPDIEASAQSFIHSLLQKQHVIDLTEEQLQQLIDQAVGLAVALHAKKE